MKKAIQKIMVVLAVIAATAGCFQVYSLFKEEKDQQKVLEQRIAAIQEQADLREQDLLDRIDELLTEEEVVFDAAPIQEQILNIGELATVSYCYTNVGTVDAEKEFSFMPCNVPFSEKHLVISMDGILKAGVDMTQVDITANEAEKTITVTIPEAKVLSNELMEESMEIHVEEEHLFSDITTEDGRMARMTIRSKAQEKAMELGVLEQAQEMAGMIIRSLIEAVPGIKDTYTIVIT